MPRLRATDASRCRALASALLGSLESAERVLESALPRLEALVGADRAALVSVPAGAHAEPAVYLHAEDPAAARAELVRGLAEGTGWPPLVVLHARGRGRPLALHADAVAAGPAAALVRTLGGGGRHALAATLRDGSTLLGFVVLLGPEPFTHRERILLGAVLPQLGRRLARERVLQQAAFATAALECTLEAIGSAALLLDRGGQVEQANGAARVLLARDSDVAARLRACAAGASDPEFTLVRVAPSGPVHYLAVRAQPIDGAPARLAAAVAHWRLTPRQAEVVLHLARGAGNKEIAAALRCAEATVELHVTAILSKAGCAGRAELVAHFWTDAPGRAHP